MSFSYRLYRYCSITTIGYRLCVNDCPIEIYKCNCVITNLILCCNRSVSCYILVAIIPTCKSITFSYWFCRKCGIFSMYDGLCIKDCSIIIYECYGIGIKYLIKNRIDNRISCNKIPYCIPSFKNPLSPFFLCSSWSIWFNGTSTVSNLLFRNNSFKVFKNNREYFYHICSFDCPI